MAYDLPIDVYIEEIKKDMLDADPDKLKELQEMGRLFRNLRSVTFDSAIETIHGIMKEKGEIGFGPSARRKMKALTK